MKVRKIISRKEKSSFKCENYYNIQVDQLTKNLQQKFTYMKPPITYYI